MFPEAAGNFVLMSVCQIENKNTPGIVPGRLNKMVE